MVFGGLTAAGGGPGLIDRVAFYAPLKPPHHPVPSGDRRMARGLIKALGWRGRKVELASRLRSFDRDGNLARQQRIERLGGRIADRLLARYQRMSPDMRPKAWVTYHAYHKSPDWLGPVVQHALDIPYMLIEASFAPKQAGGPWDHGHRAAEAAIRSADMTLAMTAVDQEGLSPLVDPPAKLKRLSPFLDPAPYQKALDERRRHRRDLADRFGLDVEKPWLLVIAMMRDDVKSRSYALLAEALQHLQDRRWQLLIVGDGAARPMVEKCFQSLNPGRVRFAGILAQSELPTCYAAADLYAWPAVREAYGMALLEAQASGLPVVAGREGGVTDVVRDGVTGVLTSPRDTKAFASAIADLLDHPAKLKCLARATVPFVGEEHSFEPAATALDRALADASAVALEKRRLAEGPS